MEATEGESCADLIPQSAWNLLGLCHSTLFTLSGLSSLHGPLIQEGHFTFPLCSLYGGGLKKTNISSFLKNLHILEVPYQSPIGRP